MKPYTSFGTRVTPQSEPIPGQTQVENNAGGFVYELDLWKAFERFLILGSEGGTYYVSEKKLTKDAALRTIKCIETDGRRAVDLVVDVSERGRAPKNDPAIFALALAASAADPATRVYALSVLPRVARIPTHLFHFVTYTRQFRGFGRGLKTAIASWYQDKPVEQLAYHAVKYQSRDGWSNADLLRLSHPKTSDHVRNSLYKWIVDGWDGLTKAAETDPRFIHPPFVVGAFEAAKTATEKDLIHLIKNHNLSREMLPTEALTKPEVWEALLEKMPIEAMIRNLGVMSKVGLLKPLSAASKTIVERLNDRDRLKKAGIHPLQVLVAMKIYSQGHGWKGNSEWTVVPAVTDALNDAFYLAFSNIEPTGKRLMIALDVSGSMSSQISGNYPLSCAEGAAAMALACARTEKEYFIHGFASTFRDLGITAKMTLNEALQRTRAMNFGATDCSVPMIWAMQNRVYADAFIVITDNETWAGTMHPSQALKRYREKMDLQAKQIVIGMTSTNFTIADPNDAGSLDVAGFDSSVPQVIQEFLR